MANTVLTSGLGMIFWAVASRLYSPQQLGEDAALISAMILLSSVSQLNLSLGIPRLLPQVQHRRWRPVLGAYVLTAVVASVVTSGFLVLAPRLSDGFAFLAADFTLGLALVATVILWNIFALQDAVLTSARWAALVPVENGLFGLLKIGVMVALVKGPLGHGVFYAWLVAMALLLVPLTGLIFSKVLPSSSGRAERPLESVVPVNERRLVTRYLAIDYVAALLSQGSTALLPLLVVGVLGQADNAYFYVAFLITAAVVALGYSLSISLVVEGAHDERDLVSLARRCVVRYVCFIAPVVAVLILAAPLVLRAFGPAYVTNGTTLLRLLLAGTVPQAVVTLYLGVERVRAHVSRVLAAEAATLALVSTGAVLGMRWNGLTGLGVAWLVAHVAVAAVVAPRLWHFFGRTGIPRRGDALIRTPQRKVKTPDPDVADGAGHLSRTDAVDLGAALVTAALLVAVGLGVTGGFRVVLALIFVTFVPGWVVLHFTPLAHRASRVAIAVTLSLSLSTLASVCLLWLNLWHPRLLLDVAGAACLAGLVWRLAHPDVAPRHRPVVWPERLVRRAAVGPVDLVLPAAIALWWVGVHAADPEAMNDYGLLPALPVVFFVAVGLLVVSIVTVLLRPEPSPLRLGLHLASLVMVLHGTAPLIFDAPIYPWLYKHVGVVGHINLHGGVDTQIDIYHNWPGFFAAASWFTRLAGAASPLDYAAWAPVYFNLLLCLLLGFAFRSLPVSTQVRWVALFVFVAGNWVGQDYFAPQALSFVLSLGVFGMLLAWMQTDHPPGLVRVARRLADRLVRAAGRVSGEAHGGPASAPPSRVAALSAVFLGFAAVVVTHQLSPYLVILGVGLLTIAGLVRPRLVVVGLAAMAIGYLLLRLPYVQRTQDLFSSFGDPLGNVHDRQQDGSKVMTGRRITALAAPGLIAFLWGLGMLGAFRRLRAGRPTLILALLAFSPTLVALGQGYGGEAVFRIYLFSSPWIALLAASALEPRAQRRPLWPAITAGAVLAAAVAMFMSAVYGAVELYAVRSGEVQASEHFYNHAEPGSVLNLITVNFPGRVGERYSEFGSVGNNLPELLTSAKDLRHRMLGDADLPAVSQFVQQNGSGGSYLALSEGQRIHSEVLGLLPPGSLAGLDQALARSPDWQVFYRNQDAVIYRFAPGAADRPAIDPEEGPLPDRKPADRSLDAAGVGAGLAGLGAAGLVLRRRRMASRPADALRDREGTHPAMNGSQRAAVDDLVAALGDDPDRAARRDAARALTGENAEIVLSAFVDALQDPEGDIRSLAVEALGSHPSAGLAHRLAAGLSSSSPDSVRAVLLGLGPLGQAALVEAVAEAPPARAEAAIALLRMTDMTASIVEDLGAVDPAVRSRAVIVLGALGGPQALEGLVQALRDPRPTIRISAARLLGEAGSGRQQVQHVADSDPAPEVREAAKEALRMMDDRGPAPGGGASDPRNNG